MQYKTVFGFRVTLLTYLVVKLFAATNPIHIQCNQPNDHLQMDSKGSTVSTRVMWEISFSSGRCGLNKSRLYLEEALLPAGLVQVGPQVLVRPYCLENMSSCFDLA